DLALGGFEAGDPDAGLLGAFLGLPSFVAGQLLALRVGLAAIAMVCFVVDGDDVFLVAETATDAADHFVGRFGESPRAGAAEDLLGQFGGGLFFARQKGVVVGDQDFGVRERLAE